MDFEKEEEVMEDEVKLEAIADSSLQLEEEDEYDQLANALELADGEKKSSGENDIAEKVHNLVGNEIYIMSYIESKTVLNFVLCVQVVEKPNCISSTDDENSEQLITKVPVP